MLVGFTQAFGGDMQFWNDLSMFNKYGLAAVAAVAVIAIILLVVV